MINSPFNNGKILIGPHLFAGLGMVGLISTSAALVPFMQKHDWVRSIYWLMCDRHRSIGLVISLVQPIFQSEC